MRSIPAVLVLAFSVSAAGPAAAFSDGPRGAAMGKIGEARGAPVHRVDDGYARHGGYLGVSVREIRRNLNARGFRVAEIEHDDDEIEIEAYRGGVEYEIEVDRRTGFITEFERDD